MDKEEIRTGYKAAIDDGYTHVAVARATGIGVSSLKNFYYEEGGFSDESAIKLAKWLDERRFLDPEWARRDPFGGIVSGLRSLATDIEAEVSFDAKRIRLRSFLESIRSHPVVIGLEDAKEAGKK